jgi:UDP-glucuronate decarboxylase
MLGCLLTIIAERDNTFLEKAVTMKLNGRKRVLVTGGAGFLGSHLCERLLKNGHQVVCVDNFFTGSTENVFELLGNPNFEVITHDVSLPLYIEVDEIFNLACPASPVHYQYDPIQTTKTSVLGAINMLGLAKRTRAKIFHASTSEVYGDPVVHPQKETYWGHVNPMGERACYDEGKRCAESLFFDYLRQHELNIRVARIFNTYGPRMHPEDGRVVSNFVVQALRNHPITIYGDGSQTRSFCYVEDLIDGFLLLMNSRDEFRGPVNLGNPAECTILELAQKVVELTGSHSKLHFRPLPADDPRRRQPDITLARTELGWEPRVPLREGLLRTIDHFESLLKAPATVGQMGTVRGSGRREIPDKQRISSDDYRSVVGIGDQRGRADRRDTDGGNTEALARSAEC